jgi:nicotinate phosphoribosyltransferase
MPETVLLVDSDDTLACVDKMIALSRQLGDNFRVCAVRLDSGGAKCCLGKPL